MLLYQQADVASADVMTAIASESSPPSDWLYLAPEQRIFSSKLGKEIALRAGYSTAGILALLSGGAAISIAVMGPASPVGQTLQRAAWGTLGGALISGVASGLIHILWQETQEKTPKAPLSESTGGL